MKIVFIGCVRFSYYCLKAILENNYEISGVCTLKESSFNNDFFDLTEISKKYNIAVKYTKNINNPDNVNWIKSLNPDIIFCFGWSKLLKKEILEIPKYGVLGYHPAHLPRNRGRHPIIWALALGLNKTASTFFFMNESADEGDILDQKIIKINSQDDANTLYEKLTKIALKQILTFLPKLETNNYIKTPQANNLSNNWRKRGKIDGLIDWRMSSENIRNLIRALTKPYCGASFFYKNNEYIIWTAEDVYCKLDNIEPGKILMVSENEFTVKCGSNAIKITDTEPSIFHILKVGDYL
tara:strand:+ start:1688 stop:2575 length:888 start_codon:yes stop_codon:yes gene_type:complete